MSGVAVPKGRPYEMLVLGRRNHASGPKMTLGPSGVSRETGFAYEVLALDDLETAAWRSLNRTAISPSPFVDPVFLRGLSAVDPGQTPRLLVVWDPEDKAPLKAVWPFITRRLPSPQLQVVETYTTQYSPLSVPLIAEDSPWRAVKTALEAFGEIAPVLTLPTLPLDSGFTGILADVMAQDAMPNRVTARGRRAALRGGSMFKDYAASNWTRSRRNKMQRMCRRLEAEGDVVFRTCSLYPGKDHVDEAFLALEAKGWKGRAGTAMARTAEERALVRIVVNELIPAGLSEMHQLLIDGRPIAMLITHRLNGHNWAWKIAYDEDYARFSPGGLLFAEVTRKFLARGDVFADSCASDTPSLADSYWHEKLHYGTMHVALGGGASKFAMHVSAASNAAFDNARNLYRALRRQAPGLASAIRTTGE
ncbi:MAG: GNAT family N-acetyltransferase [Pseudomonadota bacterium]